jgi:small subunit ribosomal protein S6
MKNNKTGTMDSYEFAFIMGSEDKKVLKSLEETIQTFEGKIGKKEEWGKKQLSYRLKNLTEAFYFVWNIQLDGTHLAQFKNKLNLEERIVRYLIIKQD